MKFSAAKFGLVTIFGAAETVCRGLSSSNTDPSIYKVSFLQSDADSAAAPDATPGLAESAAPEAQGFLATVTKSRNSCIVTCLLLLLLAVIVAYHWITDERNSPESDNTDDNAQAATDTSFWERYHERYIQETQGFIADDSDDSAHITVLDTSGNHFSGDGDDGQPPRPWTVTRDMDKEQWTGEDREFHNFLLIMAGHGKHFDGEQLNKLREEGHRRWWEIITDAENEKLKQEHNQIHQIDLIE